MASSLGKLGPKSPWENAERLTAVVRQYVADCPTRTRPLLQAEEVGDARRVIELLEKPHHPNVQVNWATPLLRASAGGHFIVVAGSGC